MYELTHLSLERVPHQSAPKPPPTNHERFLQFLGVRGVTFANQLFTKDQKQCTRQTQYMHLNAQLKR